jgi:hypothetical protein
MSAAVDASSYWHSPGNRPFIAFIILSRGPYSSIPILSLIRSSLSWRKTSPSIRFSVRRIRNCEMFEEQLEDALVNLSHITWLNPLLVSQLPTSSTVHNLGSTLACALSSPWSCVRQSINTRDSNSNRPLTGTTTSGFSAELLGDVVGRGTKDG